MKKSSKLFPLIAFAVGVSLIAASCASSGSGASAGAGAKPDVPEGKPFVAIPKATSPIALDGLATGWPEAKATEIKFGDVSGSIKLCYTEEALYVFADVVGAAPINLQSGNDVWNGNAVELCLGLNPGNSPYRTTFTDTDYHIAIATGNGDAKAPSTNDWTNSNKPIAGAEIKVIKNEKGYTLEAKLPWKHFGAYKAETGNIFYLDYALDIAAGAGGSRTGQWIWVGSANFYKDASQWTAYGKLL